MRQSIGFSVILGWVTAMVFYIPSTILLLICVYFYWSSQRKITKQIMYNRSMQHFQVKQVFLV